MTRLHRLDYFERVGAGEVVPHRGIAVRVWRWHVCVFRNIGIAVWAAGHVKEAPSWSWRLPSSGRP